MALQHADLDYWRQEQVHAHQQGRYIGIGLATCQQRSTYSATEFWFHNPGPATGLTTTAESVRIGIGPTGGITVTMFSPYMLLFFQALSTEDWQGCSLPDKHCRGKTLVSTRLDRYRKIVL